MAFKLSKQIDNISNPDLAFEIYHSYIDKNKHKFPKSVLDVMSSENWNGGSSSNAPYHSDLQSIEIFNFGKPSAYLKLVLYKHDYVEKPISIELVYKGLFQLNIPHQEVISENPLKWRYEEFLFFDPYHSHDLQEKMFTHNIEWITGEVYSITARDLEVLWQPS